MTIAERIQRQSRQTETEAYGKILAGVYLAVAGRPQVGLIGRGFEVKGMMGRILA